VDASEDVHIRSRSSDLDGLYRVLLDALPVAVLIADDLGRYIDANPAAVELLGHAMDELLGMTVVDLVVGRLEHPDEEYERFKQAGSWSGVVDLGRSDGSVVTVEARARTVELADGRTIGFSILRRAESADVLIDREKEARTLASAALANITILQEVTGALSTATTREDVADVIVHQGVAAVGASAGVLALSSEDGRELVVAGFFGYDPALMARWTRFALDRTTPLGDAVVRREAVVLSDVAERTRRYPGFITGSGVIQDHALVSLPLVIGDRTIGGITCSFDRPREFSADEIRFMWALSGQAALALDRAGLNEAEVAERERRAFVAAATEVLAQSLDYERTLSEVARLVVHGIPAGPGHHAGIADWCVVDLLEPNGSLELLAVAHTDPEKERLAWEWRRQFPPRPEDPSGAPKVVRTAQAELVSEIPPELIESSVTDPDLRAIVLGLGLSSLIIVPLIARGNVLGTLTLVAAESRRRYDGIDLAFAEELAARAAVAIDNARLFKDRDHVASSLQQILLPSSLPQPPGFELAAMYRPGRAGMEVGGDFYDAFERPDGSFGLAIGDVCGHGPEAAAVMGVARQTIRVAGMAESRPSSILRVVNDALLIGGYGRFVSVCDVRVRPSEGGAQITVCAAGHPLPVLVAPDGSVREVGRHGLLLGLFEDVQLVDTVVDMDSGSLLVLFTDGLVEWPSRADVDASFRDLVSSLAGRSAEEAVRGIEAWWREGVGSAPQDDTAVLVVRAGA
jgi:PAS domain S-box-containing protein